MLSLTWHRRRTAEMTSFSNRSVICNLRSQEGLLPREIRQTNFYVLFVHFFEAGTIVAITVFSLTDKRSESVFGERLFNERISKRERLGVPYKCWQRVFLYMSRTLQSRPNASRMGATPL